MSLILEMVILKERLDIDNVEVRLLYTHSKNKSFRRPLNTFKESSGKVEKIMTADGLVNELNNIRTKVQA